MSHVRQQNRACDKKIPRAIFFGRLFISRTDYSLYIHCDMDLIGRKLGKDGSRQRSILPKFTVLKRTVDFVENEPDAQGNTEESFMQNPNIESSNVRMQ